MAEVLGPVETLRAAAAKLRETAKGATSGPWRVVEYHGRDIADEAWGRIVIETDNPGNAVEVADVTEVDNVDGADSANAEWIALMDPGVAEPLATLLEEALPYARLPQWNRYPIVGRALAVARVLLGVPDGV